MPRSAALAATLSLLLAAAPQRSVAHPLNPALLELREREGGLVDVTWRTPATSGPQAAALRPELPTGCDALAPITSALSQAGQSLVQRWQAHCASGLRGGKIRVVGLRERRIEALVRIALAKGSSVQAVLRDDDASFVVPARAGALTVARAYVPLGVLHILSGPDHLLFVLGLLLLVEGRRKLLWTITAFTGGHSVTLSIAALGLVRIPPRPVEVAIALTLVVVAVELTRHEAEPTLARRAPWAMSFAFGLLHGLGFAGALSQVGLPAGEIPPALLSFNVGIEAGQLAFVLLTGAVGLAAQRFSLALRRGVGRLAPYVIGSLACCWVLERVWP